VGEQQSVAEFFQTLPARVPAERTAGMRNSYLFEIADVGAWHVDVADGTVTVTPGEAEADARIALSEDTFHKLVARQQSATMALLTGKVKVSGDMGAASKLQKILG
jgi:putative sterol carrier protein